MSLKADATQEGKDRHMADAGTGGMRPNADAAAPLALHGGPRAVTAGRDDPWPVIGEDEITAVVELMRAGRVSIGDGSGPIGELEDRFAAYTGARYVLMHNNGTAALHAGLYAVGVKPGDEVILPSYTWHATAGPVAALNAVPIFCESDPATLNLDPERVEWRITPRTKAIVVVHLWGNVADMDRIMAIAAAYDLAVVEDCSHAHGATWRGRQVGTIGDVGCFSLQGSKVVVGGEGGMLVTDDPERYDRALVLGSHGRIAQDARCDRHRAFTTGFGFKYRPHPLAAAIALEQLKRLDDLNARRKTNYEYLMNGLDDVPGIRVTDTLPHAERGGYYGIRLRYDREQMADVPRETFIRALRAEGVECDVERYELLHLTPYYRDCQRAYDNYMPGVPVEPWQEGDLPVTEDLHQRLIALPAFTVPQHELLEQYVQAFHKVSARIADLAADGAVR